MGVWLRVLLAVNLGVLAAAFARNRELAQLPREVAEIAAFVEPVVLGGLTLLGAAQGWLERLARPAAIVAVVIAAVAVAQLFGMLFAPMFESDGGTWRPALWAALAAALLLAWFDLRWRAHSPAVTEARLMALTARIRPHFLFNSLNAVLGVIRSNPKRAEAALEELSDLFRVLMRDNRELVPLSDEIALARQYLGLEKLRLGERLRIRWDIESCPPDALVPPLMLQPLLENAVYHGIERLEAPGEIAVRVSRQGERVAFELTNPVAPGSTHHAGNRMALANIRERLMLFFDLEAQLETAERDGFYVVSIAFPYRRGAKP
jgi:two-component system sensor histidine kinase AlgZ